MTGLDERPSRLGSGRSTGRTLVYVSVALAVAAAAVLALGFDDARLLRLGIVAALWAALAGSFAAARMRREATSNDGRAQDMRTIYQLELEREVTARREHELTVERELRRDIEQGSRAELDALRAELRTLRCNLESVLDGELLVERVALRAGSTRVRSLPEGRGDGPNPPQAPAYSARREPAARADPTRRVRPETPPQPERTSYADDPLFGAVPTRSTASNGNGVHSGNGHRPGPAGNEQPRAPEEPDGAHTGGRRSVDELLAAYGTSTPPRRHRRRDDG